jgi:hypothetical protein
VQPSSQRFPTSAWVPAWRQPERSPRSVRLGNRRLGMHRPSPASAKIFWHTQGSIEDSLVRRHRPDGHHRHGARTLAPPASTR